MHSFISHEIPVPNFPKIKPRKIAKFNRKKRADKNQYSIIPKNYMQLIDDNNYKKVAFIEKKTLGLYIKSKYHL